ncbi:MAG: phenylacetic acid degradation protein [Saprospiraceae bacterium]|nr:MAG: phenylacetic acid degradation protein [Saprospiraceae bacterium]
MKHSQNSEKELLFEYLLRLGDNALIMGHRLSEWCGHGPILEQDIALTNIALDLVGQSRSWLTYAGEVEGKGRSEDDLAYLRDAWDFRNVLLVEQQNGDWAVTIVRQFLFDVFNYYLHKELLYSKDKQIAAIAEKSLKEITYHLRYSSEWMIRLGDGTEVSRQKMQDALQLLWTYHGELLKADDVDATLARLGIGADLSKIKPHYDKKVEEILAAATLSKPAEEWMQKGGKQGQHSEHLGYILTELQFLQRAYPNATW